MKIYIDYQINNEGRKVEAFEDFAKNIPSGIKETCDKKPEAFKIWS